MRASPLPTRSSDKAAALIIALAFIVLVTGLALAYFSRTTIERALGQSSYNDTSADLLARTALDIVVDDFKQEIVNGSTATSVSGTTIYVPTAAANMVPVHSPTVAPGTTPAIPNLIRLSVRSDPMPSPGVASRASAVNSRDDPSANGRFMSTTRWNKHFLIPLGTGATIDNPSPKPAFTPPDWVIVTRAGPTPFASWDATLANPTNTNYAIGRYAYAVYDEGGLLEINVAGYPPNGSPLPELLLDKGRKGVLAWVDIPTPIPAPSPTATPSASPTPTPSGSPLARLVGFRNYATTGQNNVSNLNFSYPTNNAINAFVNYVLGSPIPGVQAYGGRIGTSRDFGAVNPVLSLDSRTDQSFMTRAELIKFFSSAVMNVNMLQYLGTFSREQNKPTLPLTPAWPFTRVILPQRFYLGNLNEVVSSGNAADIRRDFGLQLAGVGGPNPSCTNQVRWKYVGQGANSTPLSAIPAFPSDLTTLDFFQYINYALFGVTTNDSTHIPYTLGIGAALIDMYDTDTLNTGIYYGSAGPAACDLGINACVVYGPEQTGQVMTSPTPSCISPQNPDPLPTGPIGLPPINTGFRNVGEFGWTYSILNADPANNRNAGTTPKYLIDFQDAYNSTTNPDPALLDFFTFNSSSGYQGAPVRSGIVSLNTRQVPVLTAILSGALYGGTSFPLNATPATNAANSIVNDATKGTMINPAMSRADIARFSSVVTTCPFVSGCGNPPTQEVKDTFARALSEVTQTRTWGLLIDVVAQTGHYKPNATGLADFVVEGEKRYWLHVAIDRFDGTIVGQRLEEVAE